MINPRQHTLQSRHNRSSPLTHFVCVIITSVWLQGAIITSNLFWLMMAKFWLILPSFTWALQGFVKLLQSQCQCGSSFIVLLFLYHTFTPPLFSTVLCPSVVQGMVVNDEMDGWACPPLVPWEGGGDSGRSYFSLLIIKADPLDQWAWHSTHSAIPRHLSEDLIIHEHLKSFQFIKHLSSNSHVGSMKNVVTHCFIRVNRVHIIFYLKISVLTGLEALLWLLHFSTL